MSKVHKILILNKDVHEELKRIAKKEGMNTSALCRKVIKEHIEEKGWRN